MTMLTCVNDVAAKSELHHLVAPSLASHWFGDHDIQPFFPVDLALAASSTFALLLTAVFLMLTGLTLTTASERRTQA
jgi:hypothetical protein